MAGSLHKVNYCNTPQTTRARQDEVQNNAGGFVFEQSTMQKLRSFLILGTDNGSFYVGEAKLTQMNVDWVRAVLLENPVEAINLVVAVSDKGLAKSNDPALFTLALAMQLDIDKQLVSNAVQKVARTATHLFTYAQFLKNLGGWGRAKRDSVATWYESKTADQLAFQAVKYRRRNGWTHRDLLRLSHPTGLNNEVTNFMLGKETGIAPNVIEGFQKAQATTNIDELVRIVISYRLPWEAVPTWAHKELKLWRALFENDLLGQTALVRNVTRIAKLDGFDDMVFAKQYADRLADEQRIVKGRMHPISYLNAAVVFEEGQLDRQRSYFNYVARNKNWNTNSKVSSGLQAGFDLAFKTVEPSNKRTLVALDVSGSMGCAASVGTDLSCMQVGAFVGMLIVRKEPYAEILGFSHELRNLGLTENDSFGAVMRKIGRIPMGATDLGLPMKYAQTSNREIDTFVSITDSETWIGRTHPYQALKQYRNSSGIDAKVAVFGVEGNGFTIADKDDSGMMDFVGFDSSAPKILADFSAGRL